MQLGECSPGVASVVYSNPQPHIGPSCSPYWYHAGFEDAAAAASPPSSSEDARLPASLTLWPVTSAQASSSGCNLNAFKTLAVVTVHAPDVAAGYHVDMVSTNAAFLMWLTGLVYALVTPWTVAEQAHIAWILMLCAFCNFFAVATTRFNDSGFTSGLAFWLPPLFLGNFLLLFVGALPTMLVGGCLSGYFVASSQTAPVTLGVASLVALAALFFYDVWAWLPQVGHLGGAGSSEPWAAFRALSVRKKGLLEELRKASTALTSGPACFRLLLQYPS